MLMRFLYFRDHPHGIEEEEDRPTIRASLQGRRGSLDVGTALISQATRAQEAEGASADDDNAIQDVQQSESCFKIMAPYVNSFCMFSALVAFPYVIAPIFRAEDTADSVKVVMILFFVPAAHDFALLFERGMRLDALTEKDVREHPSLPLANMHLHFLVDLNFCCMRWVLVLGVHAYRLAFRLVAFRLVAVHSSVLSVDANTQACANGIHPLAVNVSHMRHCCSTARSSDEVHVCCT